MNENLNDILELCIEALNRGDSIEACLGRYPQHADELRPLLQTVAQAYEAAVFEVPEHVMRGGRARVLNHAAELRERGTLRKTPRFSLGRDFNKAFAVLALLLVLVLGGTSGLVFASNGTLPGDQLYPVKRTWEDVRLQLAFSPQARARLETEYEQERVNEVSALVTHGRAEKVDFVGPVSGVFPDRLIVSGITIYLDAQIQIPAGLALNQFVEVIGSTRVDGTVLATQITLSHAGEDNGGAEQDSQTSGNGDATQVPSDADTPGPQETPNARNTPEPESTSGGSTSPSTPQVGRTPEPQNEFKLEGVVQRMGQNVWMVNNQLIVIDPARTEINGRIGVGATVKVEGLVSADGTLLAMHVELRSASSTQQTPAPTGDSGSGSGSGGGDDHGGSGGGGDKTPTPDH